MNSIARFLFFSLYLFSLLEAKAQELHLDLFQCIRIASDSSLQALRTKNMYESAYWEYRSYRASRLPSVILNLNPIQYNRNIIPRYDYNENLDVYRLQQSMYSSASLSIQQNFDLTGGIFSFESDLQYLRSYGETIFEQFSTVPLRIGYSQSLFGFNNFKWDKKIAPLKYNKATQMLLYQIQEISENTVSAFFDLALAKKELEMAQENVLSFDTLYSVGLELQKISAISLSEILTLELDLINAQNALENAEKNLESVEYQFLAFLNLNKNQSVKLVLPEKKNTITISEEEALLYAKQNNPNYLDFKQKILETEREVERVQKLANFNSQISASIGFNQSANYFAASYMNPLQQSVVSISVNIPILDWGMKKGQLNMAKNNLNITKITVSQQEVDLEQEILLTIKDFHLQQERIASAARALQLANAAYTNVKDRFPIGKSDVNSLILSLNRQKEAQRNYISTLKYYWLSYFRLQRLTLFNFEKQEHLSDSYFNMIF